MNQASASIRTFMTVAPFAIGRDQPLPAAEALMKQHGVRHLPVVDANGDVVGVLSQRALQLVSRRWDLDIAHLPVDALTHHDVFTVPPEAPLSTVCATMAEHRYGSAIVVQAGKPLGIFTTTDACAALASFLSSRSA